jgi:hypothetical protein
MLALVSLLIASATASPQPSAAAVPPNAAVIVNSGSTNISGYRIVVQPDGRATVTTQGSNRTQQLAKSTVAPFFKHLSAAMPLGKLESEPCMKSASFGSTTTVQYKGERSPDLSCPMEGLGAALGADVQRVTSELHVLPASRILRHTMAPQPGPAAPASPSAEPTS